MTIKWSTVSYGKNVIIVHAKVFIRPVGQIVRKIVLLKNKRLILNSKTQAFSTKVKEKKTTI